MSAAPHTSPSPSLAQERTSTRTPFGLAITTLAMGGALLAACATPAPPPPPPPMARVVIAKPNGVRVLV
ncbi:hypothetical protein GVM20_16150, partial [Porphyrobacter sp. SLTP]|nr:hypothetical protein [Porphyrobacter sp. SLTP]